MNYQLSKSDLRISKPTRDEFASIKRHPVVIILDNLKCAHNVGTIIRLADALLLEEVYLCGTTISPPNAKVKMGSRGSERWVPWHHVDDTLSTVKSFKDRGYSIVSCEVTSTSIPYSDAEYSFPTCLVVGREYDGVSQSILSISDFTVSLPIHGMANSINVATATSVVLYEIDRQFTKHQK